MHQTRRRPRALKPLRLLKHKPIPALKPMAAAIVAARQAAEWSQFDLALRIGCRAQQVSVWERALKRPSGEMAEKLAAVLGVNVSAEAA